MAVSAVFRVFAARLSTTSVARISSTPMVLHNPSLKKRKKLAIDSQKQAQLRDRLDRKKKQAPISPPQDPDSMPDPVLLEPERLRPQPHLTEAEQEERILLLKEWSRQTMSAHKHVLIRLQEKLKCRQEVLRELKKVSPTHYENAIKVNKRMFPLYFEGRPESLPVDDYEAPDMDDGKGFAKH